MKWAAAAAAAGAAASAAATAVASAAGASYPTVLAQYKYGPSVLACIPGRRCVDGLLRLARVFPCYLQGSPSPASAREDERRRAAAAGAAEDRFAPRFDGLRFIETLVTAHR
ncbi:hypothetical protein ABZP36_012215 [Zizania latifolia]